MHMKNSTISKPWSYLIDLVSTDAVKSRRRSTLWLMLFTLLLLPTSMVAQTDYDTSVKFTPLAGNPEGFDNEKYPNLFDGLKDRGNSTKWCGKFVSNGGTYVIFEASKAGIPVGYTITTGNDNSTYKGRNPRSWKLYGNNEGKNGAWTLIQEVSNDTKLQDVNCASYDFTCEGSTPYKYFKWEITGIRNKDYIQVGEFELKFKAPNQAYAEFDESSGTLTFKYGSKPEGAYNLNVGPYSPKWDAQKEKIKTVVFDASFANIRPTSCYRWFDGCKNLTNIEGIENLNTENVTYMNSMFNECTALKSLDLTNFNTAKVTNMSYMFNDCSALASLNVSKFNTAEVKDMDFMFYNCSTLTSLNLSNFNNAKVTTMISMFHGCTKLESLDLSNFNTAEVTNMGCMFYNCSALTSLNLSNFNTEKVTNMSAMFENCSALTTIYASDKFVTGQLSFSTDMFSGCKNLIGAIGYDETNTNNKDYANLVDGYFSPEGGFHAYAEFDEGTGTLTFRRGVSMPTGAYELNVGINYPGWYYTQKEKIKTVVFDASFANARPTSCYYWFSGYNNLTEIKGIENLNTENVTNMSYMFVKCKALTSLNLSNFNTEKVTDMQGMFKECSDLTSLDLSNFNTEKVTDMRGMFWECSNLTSLNLTRLNTEKVTAMNGMFYGCTKLESLDLSKFNTAKVTNMNQMFYGCSALTSLDVSNFNTAEVKSMTYMFNNCSTLTSLNLSNFNTAKVTDMNSMFYNCNALTSLDLTSFNTAEVTNMSNMFRSCFALTSLDLSSFNTAKVTDMSYMFRLCKALTSLDLSNFNTAKVEDMSYMFKSCYALKSLDLTSFNTANVKNMTQMFYESPALTTIYASDNFITGQVTKSVYMFEHCNELIGAIGYAGINTNDKDYANYKTGYFTKLVAKNGDERYGIAGETAHLTVDNLTLADDKDFVAYEPFAAKAASYSRTINAGTTWATLCLPFEVSLDGQNFRAFKLLSANEGTNTIELEEVTTNIAAGTPVIIKMTNGATDLNFSVENKDITKDAQTTETADNSYQLQGLYAKKIFAKGQDDNCYIVKGNKLRNPSKLLENTKVQEVNCKAFRAYMVDNNSDKPAGAKMFSIGFDETATAIDNLNTNADDKAEYYDLQGHRLNGPQKGINIVKRGNKTMKVIIK